MTQLTVRQAEVGYPKRPLLREVTFTLTSGAVCCLLGANGSGKTTLMRSILGLLPLISGQVLIDDQLVSQMSARERARTIAWVPQAHDGAFAFSVLDMVLMGVSPHIGTFTQPARRERDSAFAQLAALGIAHLAARSWSTLSGGERQLTLIARALAQRPRLLLLDEPASSLDFGHQIRLLDTLGQLRQSGMTLLMATHHPLHALALADTVLRIEPDGLVSQGSPRSQLEPERLAKLYGVSPAQIRRHLGNFNLQE
ncbi:iron complex transport system ATP-binding protein [Raoultella sp. BIGb0138]|uniref:ABC transporter ATP-binding protein n=1 Tax=Raoultella sp. BIGb0138 TaxID=2485115 RepID=UPI0010478AC5|nr:ABC transporter ATP-binding protein [Raoultella sp. BIGb0138]TCW17422.1 iron complex transport system ATP-binding protein [Raoultella sp. BIGb0138]